MTLGKPKRAILVHISVLSGFAALTALMTWPLAFRMADSVPGWPGDNAFCVWLLWWFKRALLDLHISPYVNPFVYFPEGFGLARSDMMWANTLLALPITALWGPVVAYNWMLLLSFVLTGFATYLWVWRLTSDHVAGFIAGVIFAFSPFRMGHFPGHLNLMTTQWLPFLLYALEELAHTRRLGFAALAGLFFALNAWAAWYYFYFSLILVPLYVLLRFVDWRDSLRSLFFWRAALFGGGIAFVLIAPAAWPYLRLHSTGELQRTFNEVEYWSANPTDFFIPNLLHPLWGEALRGLVPFQWKLWVEKNLYLGMIPSLLALVALVKKRNNRAVIALVWIALISFTLALGPSLHWAGQRVLLTIPPGAMAVLYHLGITPYLTSRLDPGLLTDMQRNHYIFIPLPMLLFYLFVPYTASMRVGARFGMITIMAVAALAGCGITILGERWVGRYIRWGVLALVVVAILFEFLALPYEMTVLRPRLVDLWLAEQPRGVMVELPIQDGMHPLKDYYATVHQQAMIFGPIAGFIPPALSERGKRLNSFPDDQSIQALEEYKANYILVHTDKFENWPNQVEPWETKGQLRLIRCFDALCVYTLGPSNESLGDSAVLERDGLFGELLECRTHPRLCRL